MGEEHTGEPFSKSELKRLDYLCAEWTHPHFISIEEYSRIMTRTGVLDNIHTEDWFHKRSQAGGTLFGLVSVTLGQLSDDRDRGTKLSVMESALKGFIAHLKTASWVTVCFVHPREYFDYRFPISLRGIAFKAW